MTPAKPSSLGIRHVALGATDLKRGAQFYTEVLGFEPYHVGDPDWEMFRVGATTVSLILNSGATPTSDPKAPHPAHFGINVETTVAVDEWHQYLTTKKLPWLTAPKFHRDGSYGFYLKDSEENPLEIIFIPQLPSLEDNGKEAIVLIAHGSNDPKWREPFEALLATVRRHGPGRHFELCYMEFCKPTLEETVARLASADRTNIRVVPVFLASGAHVASDIPRIVAQAAIQFPKVTFSTTAAVGNSIVAQQGLVEGIFATLGL